MSRVSNSDAPEPFVIATPEPRRPSARAILFAGVAGACVLGVGAGLWARPGLHERKAALQARVEAPAPIAPPASRLQIVVDNHPRPAGAPLEVLTPGSAAPGAAAALPAPVIQTPVQPPQGLMKASNLVAPPPAQPQPLAHPPQETASPLRTILPGIAAAFAGARLTLTKLEHVEPPHMGVAPPPGRDKAELKRIQARELEIADADAAKAEAHRTALAKAEFVQAQADRRAAAKAEAAARAAHRAELAKAAAARAEAHRLALAEARAAKAQKAEAVRLARAQATKAAAVEAAQHKVELAREARAEKAEALRLAKAQARAKAAQREEARLEALADAAEAKKRAQLTRLARAVAHAVLPHEKPAPAEVAKADRRHAGAHGGRLEQASLKARRHAEPPRLAPAPRRIAPPPQPMAPQAADGLVRVSTDPGISAAERQLARAYQGARAAGVPEGELQRGQQRWMAARSAAAREAPWAVRDIYMARIAELNGQAKEAQGGY